MTLTKLKELLSIEGYVWQRDVYKDEPDRTPLENSEETQKIHSYVETEIEQGRLVRALCFYPNVTTGTHKTNLIHTAGFKLEILSAGGKKSLQQ